MISIKKDFYDIPKDLQGDNPEITTEVKKKLNKLYHYKCAFCETKPKGDTMHYIHRYRPVKLYPWLEFEWSNLLPVCTECNSTKRNKFPIEERRAEKPEEKLKKRYNKANSEYLLSEKPLLIHPEIDTVENHFYFSDGSIIDRTNRGRETIKICNLNRSNLKNKRHEIYENFHVKLSHNYNYNLLIAPSYFDDLYKLQFTDKEFSSLGRQMYYQFKKFIFDFVFDTFQEKYDYEKDYIPKEEQDKYSLQYWFDEVIRLYYSNLANKKGREDFYKKENEKILPVSITDVSVIKFQGITELHIKNIPPTAQWVFLTGKNGYGKTSILRAILSGLKEKNKYNFEDISENTRITIEYQKNTTPEIITLEDKIFFNTNIIPVAAYGAVRINLTDSSNKIETSASLFNSNTSLLNIETYLQKINNIEELKALNKKINDALKKLIPNLHEIKIGLNKSVTDTEVLYYEKDDSGKVLPPVSFNQLAMGMRSIIALVGDMIQRLSEHGKFIGNKLRIRRFDSKTFWGLKDLEGIVIIDEFDNHLHPKWQRDLVKKLSEIFPKVQFIVSTHSPIPLLGAPPDRTVILNVERTKEEGITVKRLEKIEKELPNLLPNVLLTSPVFGLDSIKSEYNENIDDLVVDDNYYDREKYDKLDKQIDDLFDKNNWSDNELFKE